VRLVVQGNGEPRDIIPLPHDVPAGGDVTLTFPLLIPPLLFKSSEDVDLSFQLYRAEVALGEALVVRVETGPPEQGMTAEFAQVFGVACSPCYFPSGGITRGRDGRPYPLFGRSAQGARIRDIEGNEWIDYVMGWGAALLGYGRREIREAIAAELESGAVIPLPHALEVEVAAMLGDMIPCAQMTLFGKNGSDVCTAAARMARVFTGRPKILFSGYSGWQEPFAPAFEPALAQHGHAAAIRFPANDLAQARQLLDEHAGQIAAVFVEPAAQVEAVDGPVQDADPEFLRELAEACKRHGALLVFDEILTGFRHPDGSVQRATGVTPDLACFGKALTSGMPLSVLVGRREIMAESIRRIFYHPTFKGEAYSFAAAAAALRIYATEDIPGQIAQFGARLKQAVAEAGQSAGIDGELIGPPYRMVYRFNEPDGNRRALMRTLLKQELLKRGVMTFRGFMLPSAAHGDLELEQTAEAFESALRRVRDIADADDFERHLEIPPVI
jgi:glutamate-1-semialdehyde 2,1-aminomutase